MYLQHLWVISGASPGPVMGLHPSFCRTDNPSQAVQILWACAPQWQVPPHCTHKNLLFSQRGKSSSGRGKTHQYRLYLGMHHPPYLLQGCLECIFSAVVWSILGREGLLVRDPWTATFSSVYFCWVLKGCQRVGTGTCASHAQNCWVRKINSASESI